MSVVYNGIHSITFIESSQSITAGQTLTSFDSVRNTWNSFHLVPANRPYVSPKEPKIQMVTDTVSSKVFDITDAVAGGMTYSARKGSWDFIVDHDKWSNWYTAKQTIEDYLNGKRRYCYLNGDDTLLYCGRFKVSGWEDGIQYSKITIEYDLDYETYALSANLNRPTSLSVSWKSSAPTVYEHQKKDDIRNYLNATISYGGYYTGSCDIDVIEGTFSGTGSQTITVSYTANDLSTFESVKSTASINVTVSSDYLKSISVNVNKNVKFNYGDPKDKIRQNSTIVCHYASGMSDSIAGTNANSLSGTIDGYGLYQVQMTYNGKTAIVIISLPIEYTWECLNYTIRNNTYRQLFKIGDEFPLSIGDYNDYAQIVSFDKDIDKNGNTIPVTFVSSHIIGDQNYTYDEAIEFALSAHTYVSNNLSGMLKDAKKVTYTTGLDETSVEYQKMWLLSLREVYGGDIWHDTYGGSSGYGEYDPDTGMPAVDYSNFFKNNEDRIKKRNTGIVGEWWLRSKNGPNWACMIKVNGDNYAYGRSVHEGLILGFCVGASQS